MSFKIHVWLEHKTVSSKIFQKHVFRPTLSHLFTISPVLWVSKNATSCVMIERKSVLRRRAARRSPTVDSSEMYTNVMALYKQQKTGVWRHVKQLQIIHYWNQFPISMRTIDPKNDLNTSRSGRLFSPVDSTSARVSRPGLSYRPESFPHFPW